MSERWQVEYLAAARAYCRCKFNYYPQNYRTGVLGASTHLESDAAEVAAEAWLRAAVDAAVSSAVARGRVEFVDHRAARRARRRAAWARLGYRVAGMDVPDHLKLTQE